MAFITGTATFTNGSRDVTITTGDNASPFVSNTMVFVDGTPARAVEAISGTASTFRLRVSWAFPTVTSTFTAINTNEGLGDAIQTARGFADALQNANAQLTAVANIFATTAAGLAATTNGDLFSVAGTGDIYVILYRNDSGSATELNRLSSASAIELAEQWASAAPGTVVANGLFSARSYAADAEADATQTGLDRVQTGQDRTQTGLDVTATAADRVQTGLDVTATAADRVQTGLDVVATAADRVQTGLDVTAAQTAETNAETAQTASEAARDLSQSARDIALANANFAGPWASQTGAANIPYSVIHTPSGQSEQIWMLVNNLADVTTSEPSSTNTDWVSIAVIGTTAPDSNALGGIPATTLIPLIYAGL